jgi:hypothetical protein
MIGEPISERDLLRRDEIRQAGHMSLRIVASVPVTALSFCYRSDLFRSPKIYGLNMILSNFSSEKG